MAWLIVGSYVLGYILTVALFNAALCHKHKKYPRTMGDTVDTVFSTDTGPFLAFALAWPLLWIILVIPVVCWLFVRRASLTAQGIAKLNRKAA